MKYNQPFGITDANAPYINGNPDTGTMGSIPPAESIEFPQREIANLITDVNALTPTNADLHQLGKTLQSGKINYGIDVGVVNAMIVPLSPVPDAYYGGMTVRFKAKFAPTAATTMDAGRGARSVVKSGGAVLKGSEWAIGDIITVVFEDVSQQWQLPPSPIAMLYGARTYYVNSAAGLDTNDGLTAGTAFKTLQRAQDVTRLFNLNGYTITVYVADGSYGPLSCQEINGSGEIIYQGNESSPAAVVIANSNGPAVACSGRGYTFKGFKVTSTGHSAGLTGSGMYCVGGGNMQIRNIDFGYCIDHHIVADGAAQIGYYNSANFISGGCGGAHVLAANGSYISTGVAPYPSITITAPVNIGSFVQSTGCGVSNVIYSTITGAGNVTGYKYGATANGIIGTGGAGVNYFPGTIPGSVSSGGQYV